MSWIFCVGRFLAFCCISEKSMLTLFDGVQHIGSHPHSPGRCGRRPFIFTVLRTCQMSMLTPSWLTVLMMQFWTYFWRFRQCQLNFMPFASTLHAAVAFSRATLSALDIFAASAGRSEEHTSELQSQSNLVC